MAEEKTRWHIILSGRVQHVGFRYTAYYIARDLGLTGWVDNLPDGRVEMEVQGNVCLLRKLLIRLKAHPMIRILDTDLRTVPPHRLERRFRVRGYRD